MHITPSLDLQRTRRFCSFHTGKLQDIVHGDQSTRRFHLIRIRLVRPGPHLDPVWSASQGRQMPVTGFIVTKQLPDVGFVAGCGNRVLPSPAGCQMPVTSSVAGCRSLGLPCPAQSPNVGRQFRRRSGHQMLDDGCRLPDPSNHQLRLVSNCIASRFEFLHRSV